MKETTANIQLKAALVLIAEELENSRNNEKHLMKVFEIIFPYDLYCFLRSDVLEACDGNREEILKHYLHYGINEIDLSTEIKRNNNSLAKRVSLNCLRNEFSYDAINSTNESKRELLTTMGNISKISENEAHTFALAHTSLHYKSGAVCTWIPKNGCSNIRYSIALANGAIGNQVESKWIHNNNQTFNASNKELITAPYTFTLLRNPFKRLLSFYLDKICHKQVDGPDLSYQTAQKRFQANEMTSFQEFVDFIWKNPSTILLDGHTRPQCDFLIYRKYDDYFAVEDYSESVSKIHENIGLEIIDVREFNSIYTTKSCAECDDISFHDSARAIMNYMKQLNCPKAENMYNKEMVERVSSLYLDDIIMYKRLIKNGDIELQDWITRP